MEKTDKCAGFQPAEQRDKREVAMEEKKTVSGLVIAIAIAGLLLGCVAGALAGGVTGFLVARRQARVATERVLQGSLPERLWQRLEEDVPQPTPETEDQSPLLGVRGALITEVLGGTPAEEAGIRVGDIVTAVDRTPVDRNHELSSILAGYEPGDRVTLTLWRLGQSQALRVILGEHPDIAGTPYLGIRYRMRAPISGGQGG
jgi:membrane-associated protease RseP (regulator of RpoE activity)